MPQRLRTRPQIPREIAPGVFATTNQLIIDASKTQAAYNEKAAGSENPAPNPPPPANENDEAGGEAGDSVPQ